jgi:catechol 2,3-dioxygenase-like lactoylglutathione lyase family enzyme
MPERLITHLRHVDLAIPDFRKQLEFYTSVWGLTQVGGESGVAFLAAEGSPEQYVVRLRQGDKRLDLVAFGAENPAHVDELAARLAAKGVTLIHEPKTLDTLGGGYGFRFFDLDGRAVEVSSDVATRQHRKIEEKEAIPVRLSHVVLNAQDIDRTRDWYIEHLDFGLSDTLGLHPEMGNVMHFLRCNPRHHSFAIAKGPHVSVHHVSFEMRGIDEYMRGSGRVIRSGATKVWGPGRHLAGDNTFSYFLDPQGNTIEYTTELAELDEDTWHPHIYDMHDPMVQDQWGTSNPMNELVAKESFNDEDPGLFQAPPL